MKNKINFRYFSGAELYAFVRALLKIVDSIKLVEGIPHSLAVKLEAVFQNFSKGLEYSATDPLTKQAVEKDELRDQCYSGMKNYIRSFLRNTNPGMRSAAQSLEAVIRKYGWSAETYSYDEETTAISKCVEEIGSMYATEATMLNLTDLWLNPLIEAQTDFDAIQKQRIQNGAVDVPTMTRYRVPLRKAVRKLVETLDTFAENSADETIQGYVNEIDELIGRTMATLKAVGNREPGSNKG